MEWCRLLSPLGHVGVAPTDSRRPPPTANQGGIESTKIDPRPRMPYVVFRHMGPHFDSYANSGIPEITGTEYQPFSGRGEDKRPDLLHLLPHLRPNDVGLNALTRIRDLQQLATAIERDSFYYIIIQTYEVGLHSRRHPIEIDAGTRPFASLDAPIS